MDHAPPAAAGYALHPGANVAGDSSLLRLTMLLLAHPIALALVAVALLACCGCVGSRICRARRRRQAFRRDRCEAIARQFRDSSEPLRAAEEETRHAKRE